MNLYRPNKPTGTSKAWLFFQAVWEMLWNGKFPFMNSDSVKFHYVNGHYFFTAALPSPAAQTPAPDWANPIVHDVRTYKKGEVVVIRPTDFIVTTGLFDINTRTRKKAIAGTWKATQDTRKENAEGFFYIDVPQWPLPTANNPDAANVYWWPVAFYPTTTVDCKGVQAYQANAQPPST